MRTSRPRALYALCDPESGAVRYIGLSVDPQVRVTAHRNTASPVGEWLRGLGERPHITILKESASTDDEAAAVRSAHAAGEPLLNQQLVPGRMLERRREIADEYMRTFGHPMIGEWAAYHRKEG